MRTPDENQLTFCPLKETRVYKWVCQKKCTHSQEQCETALREYHARTRFCLHCGHRGDDAVCDACMTTEADCRLRPLWASGPGRPPRRRRANTEQLRLF